MGYSAVATADLQSVDAVSPGAPAFLSVIQADNANWAVSIQLPLQDADGSALTGLTRLSVSSLPMMDGVNPFLGLSMEECMALPGVVTQDVPLTVGDAGTTKDLVVPVMNLGGFQAFAAAVSDQA
jgi:hypothetical protein